MKENTTLGKTKKPEENSDAPFFNGGYSVQTTRLILKPLCLGDVENLLSWVNDADVVGRFVDLSKEKGRNEEIRYISRILASEREKVFSIFTEEEIYLGQAGLHEIDWDHKKARMSLIIGNKAYWNKGYGQATVEELKKIAFEELGLHKLWGVCLADNVKVKHFYTEKCGFRREGVLREEYCKDGKFHDMIRFAVTQEEASP